MNRTLGTIAILLTLTFSSTVFAQEQAGPSQDQAEPKEHVGEGVVVAFQKYNRYPDRGPIRGFAHFVEYWIVRIDKWPNETEPLKEKYFRVQYNVYEGGVTDTDINATRLRFRLREVRENEHTDCYGTQREPSDYVRTTPGKKDSIPPFDSLPCLVADFLPIVIPQEPAGR